MTPQTTAQHLPVMVSEALTALPNTPGALFIDCNLGDGGHAEAIFSAVPDAHVLGIDLDADAIQRAERRLSPWAPRLTVHQGNFADLAEVANRVFPDGADAALFDLGVSSAQLDAPERGFSFRFDSKPDMRFDPSVGVSAHEIINRWPRARLERLIRELGEEPRAGRVARAIVSNRPIDGAAQLARVVARALNWRERSRVHPATRTFQALRMEVNDEAPNLERGLTAAVQALRAGGRLAVISYHSIEDRIAKNFIRNATLSCVCPARLPQCVCDRTPTLKRVSRRVIRPAHRETRENPRSRSARMRVAEKI